MRGLSLRNQGGNGIGISACASEVFFPFWLVDLAATRLRKDRTWLLSGSRKIKYRHIARHLW